MILWVWKAERRPRRRTMNGARRPTSWPAIAPTKARRASRAQRSKKQPLPEARTTSTPPHPFKEANAAERVPAKGGLGQTDLFLNREVT